MLHPIPSNRPRTSPVFSARASCPRSRRPAAACGSVGQIAGARSCLGKVKISIARARADPVRMQPLRGGGGGTQVRRGEDEIAAYYERTLQR